MWIGTTTLEKNLHYFKGPYSNKIEHRTFSCHHIYPGETIVCLPGAVYKTR